MSSHSDLQTALRSGNDGSAKRLSDGSEWILDVCRRFSDATNWPLLFSPHDVHRRQSPECCWSSTVMRRGKPFGRLHFDLPQDPGNDRSFLSVCEMAEVVSQLISQSLSASYSLEKQKRSTAVLLDGDAVGNGSTITALAKYLEAAVDLAEFRSAAFFLLTDDVRALRLRLTFRVNGDDVPKAVRLLADRPLDAQALETGDVTVSAGEDSVYRAWLPDGHRTGHCVVVRSESGPAGTLWLYDRRLRSLDDEEKQTIDTIARRMGEVLERVVLLRESDIHQRQTRDLEAASVAQSRSTGSIRKETDTYEVATVCASRYEIGGDFCEIAPLSGSRLLFVVGDASGDSVPAAMVMSSVRGAMRAQFRELDEGRSSLLDVIRRTNETLCALCANHQFMSMTAGVIDFGQRKLTYANAGHPPLMLLRDGDVSRLSHHDLLLAVDEDMTFSTVDVDLQPGDVLLGFTDGIHETMDANGDQFGLDGLETTLGALGEFGTEEILTRLQQAVTEHSGGSGGNSDDNTLFVLRVK